jgi:hypothetical protein
MEKHGAIEEGDASLVLWFQKAKVLFGGPCPKDGVRQRGGRLLLFPCRKEPDGEQRAEANSPWLKSAPLLKLFDAENVSS